MTVTLVQFAVGSVLITTMWALNLYKRPKITGAQVPFFVFMETVLILEVYYLLTHGYLIFTLIASGNLATCSCAHAW